jgi:phage N-6-adenine-methyltransferase
MTDGQLAAAASILATGVMDRDEAFHWKAQVASTATALRTLLWEGYQRQAWKALGYAHWTACLQAIAEEYGFTERRLWQLHAANVTEAQLNPGSVGQIPEKHLRVVASLPSELQPTVWQEVVAAAPDGKITTAHVQHTVESLRGEVTKPYFRFEGSHAIEWYTPPEYIAAAREVMGTIDVDPATSEKAQAWIGATQYFTAVDNGLLQQWHGSVWLNPPYAQPLMGQFVEKLLEEYHAGRTTAAILLTHAYTDTTWFHQSLAAAARLCFTRGRIRFISPEGMPPSPTQGQTFFYFGPEAERFSNVFEAFGCVLGRCGDVGQ